MNRNQRLRRLAESSTILRIRIVIATLLLTLTTAGCTTFSQHRSKAEGRWNEVRARTRYQLASQQFERAQTEKAIETIREAIATDATSSHPFLLLARCLLEQGRHISAREAAEQAELRAPASAEIAYTLGVIAERAGTMEMALKHFRRAGSLDRTVSDYLVAEAECLVVMGQVEEAADLISANVSRLDSDGTLEFLMAEVSLLRGGLDTALPFLRSAFHHSRMNAGQGNETSRARMVVEEFGRLLSNVGRHTEAIAVIAPHVRRISDVPASVVNALCVSYLATGQIDEATEQLRREVRKNPSNIEGWMLLARGSMMADDWTTARRCAEKLERLAPNDSLSHLLLGYVTWKQSDLKTAENALLRSLDVEDNAMAHDLLARVLSDAGRPRALVESHVDRAQRLDPRLGRMMPTWEPLVSTDPATGDASSQDAPASSSGDGTRLP